MTGPQPGVGSPILQTPVLRPTDVVREPGLDPQTEQTSQIARLLMAKGQLALENEKFQASQQQLKQHKQQLDMLGQQLSQAFSAQNTATPEGLRGAIGSAMGPLTAAGAPAEAARLGGELPGLLTQEQANRTRSAVGGLLNTFLSDPAHVHDPAAQAELLFHAMTQGGTEYAKPIADALKPLQQNLKFPIVPGVGLLGLDASNIKRDPDGNVTQWPNVKVLQREPPKPGTLTAQKRNDLAGIALQHVSNLQKLMGGPDYNPKFTGNIEPTTAAGAENIGAFAPFKALMGALGAGGIGPGTPEAASQELRDPNRQSYKLQVQGLIYNYAVWMSGSPRSMPLLNLISKTVDPPAGSTDEARRSAWSTIQQMKDAMIASRAGKPVQWENLPFFSEIQTDAATEGTPQPQQQPGQQQAPLTAEDLLGRKEEE